MSNLKDSEFIAVRLSAVEYLKEKFPALCEASGLCERVAGRLYTVTKLRTEETCVPVTVSEKGDKCVTNLTQNEYDALVRDAMLHRVSKKGEAEALLKSASALLGGSHNSTLFEDQCGHLASQIDAYLSRRQG